MKNIFSQIIITYNHEDCISRCLDSVLNQSVLADEIIIGDDCSSDKTREIVKEYQKKYPSIIKLAFHEKNLGIASNLNACIEIAKGNFIGFLAGDDWILDGKNEKQFEYINKYSLDYDIFYSDFYKIFENTGVKRINTNLKKNGNLLPYIARRLFSLRTFWLKKEYAYKIGLFDKSLYIYEDWHFRLKLAKVAKFKYVPGVFSVYYVHSKGIHKVKKEIHNENITKLIDRLNDFQFPLEYIELVRGSFLRMNNQNIKAFKIDPLYSIYSLLFKLNYYLVNIFKK